MMLGSMPVSGETPSQFWAYDPLIMVFAITYNFLVLPPVLPRVPLAVGRRRVRAEGGSASVFR